jgi:hypothetical protein
VHALTLPSATSTAALTVGLVAYASLIFAGIAVAIAAATMVGVLTLCGLVIAIVSSVA